MKLNPNTRYTPTDNGYAISASSEVFNRTLYGSHKNDDKRESFFTFAGDAPEFMGAITDWSRNSISYYAKCGTLRSGLALTPGQKVGFCYSPYMDTSSRWFHDSSDIVAEYKNGWMEYALSQMSLWFPDVEVKMECYPLMPDDGFLVHYNITTDQRCILALAYGGLTDFLGRFEYKEEKKRLYHSSDSKGNKVELGKNFACIIGEDGTKMHIGISFDGEVSLGSSKSMEDSYPSTFLASEPESDDDRVVKISKEIGANSNFDGYIVVMYNSDEKTLQSYLADRDAIKKVKREIYSKYSNVNIKTPENPLDLTVNPTIVAIDQSWHENSFHHGAFGYHAPFLGWRGWYAPTAIGWTDRVEKTMSAYLEKVKGPDAKKSERIFYNENVEPDGNMAQMWGSQYATVENPYGHLQNFLPGGEDQYNMQECAFDMMMYCLEWTGNTSLAGKYFDKLSLLLDREERYFEREGGLYENMLNTWISDGHSYNGAGCAQSSAYNYRANVVMALIAKKLGKDASVFEKRAERIRKGVDEKLWLKEKGILAESVDNLGNRLIHPSPELSTTYLAIDCGIVDKLQAYTMLKYTENHIKNIVTPGNGGRLCYSANWKPKKYSTYGLFPAENAHLALAYYQTGLKEEGKKLLDGIVDCYFSGRNPGMAPHVQSNRCTGDIGDLDFTDVSGTYLRLMTEGLFGIRLNSLTGVHSICPNFPPEWESASLELKDISLHYSRKGNTEDYDVFCEKKGKKVFRVYMRASDVEAVYLDGELCDYEVKAYPAHSFIFVETEKVGRINLKIMHGSSDVPKVNFAPEVMGGNRVVFEVSNGNIIDYVDVSGVLENAEIIGNKIYAKVKDVKGDFTLFIRVQNGEYDAFIPCDFVVKNVEKEVTYTSKPFEALDISKHFNESMENLHSQKYVSPTIEKPGIRTFINGRYAWEWTHGGHNKVIVKAESLRNAGGLVTTKSGIPFIIPSENENLACVSVWDNFPSMMEVALDGKAEEIAVMFIAATNCMQTHVENARITVEYKDGESENVSLILPENIDDWLIPAIQSENETFYFSDYNHAIVQRIKLKGEKELKCIKFEAVANEVILGVMGVSIAR